jgi:cyclopropane fatty-acyl-phospholipid synthase-like methyltransferase
MNSDFIRKQYNKIADEYLKHRNLFKSDKYLEILINLLPTGATILDIGCGAGIPIDKYLLEKGFRVIGIDISDRQIELATKNVPTGIFKRKDMLELKDKEYSVDAVISFYAIFHTPRKKHLDLFKKIKTFLPKGGIILVTMGYGDWEGKNKDFFGGEMEWSYYDAEKNKAIIKKAGFEIIFNEIDNSGGEKHLIVIGRSI